MQIASFDTSDLLSSPFLSLVYVQMWNFWNEMILLCVIRAEFHNYDGMHEKQVWTSTVSSSTISTSTNFQKVLHKVVLVGDLISKIVLVELNVCTTQLVRIWHSMIFGTWKKSYYVKFIQVE